MNLNGYSKITKHVDTLYGNMVSQRIGISNVMDVPFLVDPDRESLLSQHPAKFRGIYKVLATRREIVNP
jgi:hypothetical protein